MSEPQLEGAVPRGWRTNATLFVATVVTVIAAGVPFSAPAELFAEGASDTLASWLALLPSGWPFAVPLLGILLCHEFGHYFAARHHGVEVSLPYFLPLPLPGSFGTLGAVIAMRGRIRSSNALLDIGASGPIAGVLVAFPVLAVGLRLSPVQPISDGPYVLEGQSLFYLGFKRLLLGPIPDGYDVFLHPTAMAGWVGLLITMINLIPWGQLDGGHVAYALFGERQDRYARWVRVALLGLFGYNLVRFAGPVLLGSSEASLETAVSNSLFWLVWSIVLTVLGRISGGAAHPPVDDPQLSPRRRWVAVGTLVLFVLLFMPTPMAVYE